MCTQHALMDRMKSYMLLDRLLLNRSDGAIVRLVSSSRNGESLEVVEERMDQFLSVLSPELDRFIPAVSYSEEVAYTE